ncbi:C3HC zinc finger-like-domain-containing protein [Lipomyces orientalis]|uniref:C3HC zinc finger-like-domain-containing protein n=1 Tax=Lipomyces orientalis TaxID=1233043 RepID=A0ACC3TNB2_9ASCO
MSSTMHTSDTPPPQAVDGSKQKINDILSRINPFAQSPIRSIASTPISSRTPLRSLTGSPGIYSSPAKRFRRRRIEKLKKSGKLGTSTPATPISGNASQIGDTRPMYAPWSREKLLKRVSTFSLAECSWDYDPTKSITSPLLWARCGWTCARDDLTGRTIVKCELCSASRSFEEVIESHIPDARGLLDASRTIKTTHAETCLWRKRGCDDKLYSLSLSLNLESAQKEFANRLQHLLLAPFLATVEVIAPCAVDENVLAKYRNQLGLESPSAYEHKIFERAFVLALAGWECADSTVTCSQCFKTYTPGENTPFDAVKAHVGYCPWATAIGGPDPGWKLLLAILKSSTSVNNQPVASVSDQIAESVDGPMPLTPSIEIVDEDREKQLDKERKLRIERLREMYIYRPKKPRKRIPGTSSAVR